MNSSEVGSKGALFILAYAAVIALVLILANVGRKRK